MQDLSARRKRRRRPTFTPRFGPASIAFEIGLLRMTLEAERELERKKDEKEEKK
jgi:hypothetical protein